MNIPRIFSKKMVTTITESNFKVTTFQNANIINLTKSNKLKPKGNKIIMKQSLHGILIFDHLNNKKFFAVCSFQLQTTDQKILSVVKRMQSKMLQKI